MTSKKTISIQTLIHSPLDNVWKFYTLPEHIKNWNHASDDWQTTRVKNDFKSGGKFLFRMEAKDKSEGFDFEGIYNKIRNKKLIQYTIVGGRKVIVTFNESGKKTKLVIEFEAENENSLEMQRTGWQSILENFKKYVEEGI